MKEMGIFDRKIRLTWLDAVAEAVLHGDNRRQIGDMISEMLAKELKGTAKGGAVDKTRRVIMRMWFYHLDDAPTFADCRQMLLAMPLDFRRVIYFGLAVSSFSFFRGVAEVVGRLARLQSEFTTIQIQRRLQEAYGDRELTRRAGQHVFRTFVEWGLLAETGNKGEYRLPEPLAVNDTRLALWLFEALLHSCPERNGIFLHDFQGHPGLFPFALPNLMPSEIALNQNLETFTQGVTKELVMLRQIKSGQQAF